MARSRQLMPAVVTDFYGLVPAVSLVGLIFGLGPAGGLGPVLAGWLFDSTGSYVAALGLGARLNLLALVFAVPGRRSGIPAGLTGPRPGAASARRDRRHDRQ